MIVRNDVVSELKTRAEILHARIRSKEPVALTRLRILPEFRKLSLSHLIGVAATVKRAQCLAVVAGELGFPSWPVARQVLAGDRRAVDFGTLLCPPACAAHFNPWYRSHQQAARVRGERNGYLLAYKRQFFVVDRFYVETLGLDPDDADWARLGFDWAKPRQLAARTRLYARLVARLPREAA